MLTDMSTINHTGANITYPWDSSGEFVLHIPDEVGTVEEQAGLAPVPTYYCSTFSAKVNIFLWSRPPN